MLRNMVVRGFAVLALAFCAAASANASSIKLSDGVTTKIINDGEFGDANPLADVVTFIASIGAWQVNLSTGSTLFSEPTAPLLSLISLNATSNAGGTLTISFTDIGFGPTGLGVFADISGLTNGTVKYRRFRASRTNLSTRKRN